MDRCRKGGVKELDEDKLCKLVDLNGLGTAREVSENFDGIAEIIDEYFDCEGRFIDERSTYKAIKYTI